MNKVVWRKLRFSFDSLLVIKKKKFWQGEM